MVVSCVSAVSARMARCRRAIWKGPILEQCVLEAFCACRGTVSGSRPAHPRRTIASDASDHALSYPDDSSQLSGASEASQSTALD
jgi:hypothetical protein